MSEGDKRFSGRINQENLTPEERLMIEAIDQRMAAHPPLYGPSIWADESKMVRDAVLQVNCALNHLFSLAGLTPQQRITYLLEKAGSLIGEQVKSNEQIASTLSAMISQAIAAAREFHAAKQTQDLLDKILSGQVVNPETRGEPN